MAKTQRKQTSSSSSRRFLTTLLGFGVSFLCGYATALWFDLNQLTLWVKTHVPSVDDKTPSLSKQASLPKPKFEFYTLLSKEQNAVSSMVHEKKNQALSPKTQPLHSPKSEVIVVDHSAKGKTPNVNDTTAIASQFVLQVASFKKQEDAERLKATLILKGFNVSVRMVSNQGVPWHRVLVGPYKTQILAEKAQETIARSEHILGVVRKANA